MKATETALLRQSVPDRLVGYEHFDDGQRLSQDAACRPIGSGKPRVRGEAPTSRLRSFETEMFGEEEKFAGPAGLNQALIGRTEVMDCGGISEIPNTENRVETRQSK